MQTVAYASSPHRLTGSFIIFGDDNELNSQCGIYKIICSGNNKVYIGQSTNIHRRYKSHITDLKANKHHNPKLQYAFNKYGEDSFRFEIIELCDKSLLDERENYYIDFYNAISNDYGFNLKTGGNAKSEYSDESRQRISDGIKRHFQLYGMSEEQRQKYREATKGRWEDPEYYKQMCEMNRGENNAMYGMRGELAPWYGRRHTDEENRKSSEGLKRAWQQHPERRKPENNPFYGKKHSPETIAHLSALRRERMKDPKYRLQNARSIVMLDLDMHYEQTFESIRCACRYIGCTDSAISNAFCKHKDSKVVKCKGHYWVLLEYYDIETHTVKFLE